MLNASDINKLSERELREILLACDQVLYRELGIQGAPQESLSKDLKDKLIRYIYSLTGQKDIKSAYKTIYEKWEASTQKAEEVSQTVPQKESLEKFEEEAKKRKAQEAESEAAAKAQTQKFITTQKQIYLNLPKKINPPQITPEEEAGLNNLIQDKVKKNPTLYADTLARKIVKQNTKPEITKDQIKTLEANTKLVAINYTDKLLGLESKEEILGNAVKIAWAQNPIHVAASLANPDNPLIGGKTAGAAQTTTLTLENDHLIARNLLSGHANPKILRLFYPGANEIILFEVSDRANEKTVISVDKEAFTNQGIKLEQTNNQIFELVKDKAWGDIKDKSWKVLDRTLSNTPWYSKIKSLVPDFLRPRIPIFAAGEAAQPGFSLLWSSQGIRLLATDLPTLLSSSFGEGFLLTPAFNFQFGSFAVSRTLFTTAEGLTGQALGINIGNFGITLIKGGEKGLQILINLGTKAAAPVVTGAAAGGGAAAVAAGGLSGWLAGIMAALGVWGGPILMAVGALVGWLAGKLLSGIVNWMRKHQDVLKIIGAIILGAGFLLRSLPLMVMGGLIFVPLAISSGVSMAGVGAGLFLFFRSLGKSMAITIGVPVIVAIIAFPILVAIILFIINSGAYIVPPKPISDVPFEPSLECTTEKAPVSFSNSTSSPIAKRAWEITADLYQGFWCFWNRSPDDSEKIAKSIPGFPKDEVKYPPNYPELFNENLFISKPNPTREEVSSCGECLFWCTWLVQKAYKENGVSIEYTLWSPTMQADFIRRGKFIPASQASPAKVAPGSVIFFDVVNSLDRTDHVGIIHSINIDHVSFVQSNAGTKDGFVPFNSSGVGLQNIPGIAVIGIGTP